jgi:hypothetical protein
MYRTQADVGRPNNYYVSLYEQFLGLATTYFVSILNCRGKARFFVAAFCSGHNIVKKWRRH